MTSILILHHQRPDGEVDSYHLKAGRRYHLGRGSQCQVRILDLKLSRQHCAFEFRDERWMLIDLASTNGCSLDGSMVSGNVPIQVGSVISAGTTSVTVATITSSDQDPAAPRPEMPAVESEPATPLSPETGPPAASERLAAAVSRSGDSPDDLEPHAQPNRSTISDPLIPTGVDRPQPRPAANSPLLSRPTPVPTPAEAGVDHDVLATMAPGVPAPAASPQVAEPGTRTFYINVLGRRVGPLSRAQARELKTRELKGTLTPDYLHAVEAATTAPGASTAAPPPAAHATPLPQPDPPPRAPNPTGDEQATYYITLLGRRVGPLTRSQARELKARELRGQLAEADIAHLASR